MTAGGGDPWERSQNEGQQPPSGGYEPPPIEQTPAYGGYPPVPPPPGFPYSPGNYTPPPEYGAPYPTGYGYPTQPTGTNSLAIFSLVVSVLGLLCGIGSISGIGSIIGIVLGTIAISQIKKTRQKGYGLAVAGIVVGVASLVISIVWMTFVWSTPI